MLAALAFAVGLVLPSTPLVSRVAPAARASRIALCDAADAQAALEAAAARVVAAAELFGPKQKEAAAAWVGEAVEAGEASAVLDLLEKQLSLFDECLIDDEGGKCKELDAALTAIELQLAETQGAAWVDKQAQLERASKRVKKAATDFGPEQAKAADVWIAGARAEGSANPAMLLHALEYLFGECLLVDDDDDDMSASSARCEELQDAIAALQASLGVRGKVVSTAGLLPKPSTTSSAGNNGDDASSAEEPPPEGFQWGGSY